MRNAFALLLVLAACEATPVEAPETGGIVAWGDSLTMGFPGGGVSDWFLTSYPKQLEAELGRPVFNGGVGGQTSREILARIIADTVRPRLGFVGHELDEGPDIRPTVLSILWLGRNGRDNPAQTLLDIEAAVQLLEARGSKVLVLSVLNGAREPRGSAGYAVITSLNATLLQRYGERFFDVRSHLVKQYDPAEPGDVADHAADVPPRSLRSDDVHPNPAGNRSIAIALAGQVRRRGW